MQFLWAFRCNPWRGPRAFGYKVLIHGILPRKRNCTRASAAIPKGRTSRPEKLLRNFVSVIGAKRSAVPATWQKARGAQGIGGALKAARSGLRSKREGRNPRKARFFCGLAAKKCANMTVMTEKI
jgi:hypothetical protein